MFDSTVPTAACKDCVTPPRDPRWALIVAILGSGMAFLDGSVVNVALPVIQRDLGMSASDIQWVVEAYALMLSSLVLVGGALGDRLGRVRVFSIGVALFALASVACGFAPNPLFLNMARAVQGIGAALLVPGSLSIISAAYPEEKRGAAIGTWSAFSAITAAIGPVLGGWVVTYASWRWLFFFNVPAAAAVIVFAVMRVTETRDDTASNHTDWLGASLVTVGLGLIVYALIGAEASGNAQATIMLIAGFAILIVFVIVESHVKSPMVPLSLFRSRNFSGTNLLTFFLYAALGGALFFVPFNLIQVQHYTPAAAGASLLPFVILIFLMSRWASGLAVRIGTRPLLIGGPVIAGAGFALLAVPSIGGTYWTTFFPGVVILGCGMGFTVAPLTTAVMGSVDSHHSGVASGINNAVARAAGLLAVAGLGVILVMRFNGALDSSMAQMHLSSSSSSIVSEQRSKGAGADLSGIADSDQRVLLRGAFDDAYVSGFRTVMLCGALLSVLSVAAAWKMMEKKK